MFKTIYNRDSNSAVGKRILQVYGAISKQMTGTSGDNSWFIKLITFPLV